MSVSHVKHDKHGQNNRFVVGTKCSFYSIFPHAYLHVLDWQDIVILHTNKMLKTCTIVNCAETEFLNRTVQLTEMMGDEHYSRANLKEFNYTQAEIKTKFTQKYRKNLQMVCIHKLAYVSQCFL